MSRKREIARLGVARYLQRPAETRHASQRAIDRDRVIGHAVQRGPEIAHIGHIAKGVGANPRQMAECEGVFHLVTIPSYPMSLAAPATFFTRTRCAFVQWN